MAETHLCDKKLELDYHFETWFPVQAFGTIVGNRFYFRARGGHWTFAVADENSNTSDPVSVMINQEGFIRRGRWNHSIDDRSTISRKAHKIIVNCAKKFIEQSRKAPKKYQDRIVAFVDILGFKKIVDKTLYNDKYFNRIINAIGEIRSQFLEENKTELQKLAEKRLWSPEDLPDYRTMVHQVSDSMIISKLANVPGALEELISDVALAIHILIKHGLLCRGCIEYGKMYHSADYVIGPAYIAAYLGEEILVDPAICLSEDLYNYGLRNRSPDPEIKNYFDHFVVRYSPRNYFIDYFNDYTHYMYVFESPDDHYKKLKAMIRKGYQQAESDRIRAKYQWMKDRFNQSMIVTSGRIRPIRK